MSERSPPRWTRSGPANRYPFLLVVLLGLAVHGCKADSANVAADGADADTDTDADSDVDTDSDADFDTGRESADTGTNPCGTQIVHAYPTFGQSDVYHRTVLEWTFAPPDPTASVVLRQAGTPVSGVSTLSQDRLVFEPDAPLAPLTTYGVDLTLCDQSTTVATSFTTSDVGPAVPDPSTLEQRVWVADLASGRYVEPAGVGALLQQQIEVNVLVQAMRANTQLQLLAATSLPGSSPPTQDLCVPTTESAIVPFVDNPHFAVPVDSISLDVAGVPLLYEQVVFTGAFAPDGTRIEGGTLSAVIDTRPLVPLVDPGGNDDEVCNLVLTFGVSCTACADGGDFCLDTEVDRMTFAELSGGALVPRTPADIAADPNCAP